MKQLKPSEMKNLPVIERMRGEYLDRVIAIERASFSQPYSRDIFEEELTLDIARPQVLKMGEEVVGFIDYWIVRGEVHLINIAIDPAYRRQHLGSLLMNHLEDAGREAGATKIFLDVRKSNESAIALYAKFGYQKVGVRRRYYSENNEDALVMMKEL